MYFDTINFFQSQNNFNWLFDSADGSKPQKSRTFAFSISFFFFVSSANEASIDFVDFANVISCSLYRSQLYQINK